jgi:hypothetical protein
MQVRIDILGALSLEFRLEQRDGGWVTTGFFPKWPDRPGAPHVSVMEDGDKLDVHFTAFSGRPNAFRRKLVRPSQERVANAFATIGDKLQAHFSALLVPADLTALEQDGWLAHFIDRRALYRWIKSRRSNSFVFDDRAFAMLLHHVVRHGVRPTILGEPDGHSALLLMRRTVTQERLEARPLLAFPDGCGASDPSGQLVQRHPRGWYTHPFEVPSEQTMLGDLPKDKVEATFRRVERLLSRFPTDGSTPIFDPHTPVWVSQTLGFFGSEILNLVIAAAIERAEQRAKSAQAHTASAP